MKLKLFCLVWLIGNAAVAQPPVSINIEYDVRIRDLAEGFDDLWFKNNIEGSSRMPWITALLDSARAGNLPVYDMANIDRRLAEKEVEDIFVTLGDEMDLTDIVTGSGSAPITYIPLEARFTPHQCAVLRFREQWAWNDRTGWTKTVLAFAPIAETTDHAGNPTDTFALFWIKAPQNTYLAKTITSFIEYTVIFPQDGSGLAKTYPAFNTWFHGLLKLIETGKTTAFDQDFNNRMGVGTALPWAELSRWLGNIQQNIKDAGTQRVFAGIRFRERWDWHPDKGLTKSVIAMAPMVAVYGNGEFKGNVPLLWLQF